MVGDGGVAGGGGSNGTDGLQTSHGLNENECGYGSYCCYVLDTYL